jgi:hypothetical protein
VCVTSADRQTIVESLYDWDADSISVQVCGGGGATQDPHLVLAYGGRADFRGRDGALYNLVSAPDTSVNIKTTDSLFKLGELNVRGSFMTEVHFALRTLSGKPFRLTYDAARLDEIGAAHDMVNATCGGGQSLRMGPKSVLECDELRASIDFSTLTVVGNEWAVKVTGQPVFGRVAGPHHRVDVRLEPLVVEDKLATKPHGLVGQSFDGSKVPRYGRVDQYPSLEVPADFTTAAMAEGAIEGVADDYEVSHKYATAFKFSRFAA